jgi:hypothetical protein
MIAVLVTTHCVVYICRSEESATGSKLGSMGAVSRRHKRSLTMFVSASVLPILARE